MSFPRWIIFFGVGLSLAACATTPPSAAEVERRLEERWRSASQVASVRILSPAPSPYHELLARTEATEPGESLHYLTLLEIGETALLARLHLIRSARETIDIQTFIWDSDEVGLILIGELHSAARQKLMIG